MRPAEVAEHLGLSTRTVYAAVRSGAMRHARIGRGRSIVIEQAWADAYLHNLARGGTVRDDGEREPRSSEQAPMAS
jgi:excisionase family DNA binding protein